MHKSRQFPAKQFQKFLSNWYESYGRKNLPWRSTHDPYVILVSELMLQQTQVSRVIPKYQAFIECFPDLQSLRQASLAEVLALWQGLGYNRRAKYLWQLAQETLSLPETEEMLGKLPGIGPYTAAAICAFAYNQPVVLIETNVRSVFLYHFFPEKEAVDDKELLPLIEASLDRENPRIFYAALMDYGSHLKSTIKNPNRKSRHYTKQSTFSGSLRQVRGQIVKLLLKQEKTSFKNLKSMLKVEKDQLEKALASLLKDGLIEENDRSYSIKQNST